MTETVLISGANRGIGLETAKQLAEQGNTVIIGARKVTSGQQAIEAIVASGVSRDLLATIQLDVTSDESVNAAATQIKSDYPKLSVLVNNAGVAGDMEKPALSTTAADYEATMAVNFYGSLRMMQAFLPLLEAKHGRIANLTGFGQVSSFYHPSAYLVSKMALNSLIQTWAVELTQAKQPVSVFGVFPGGVSTDINNHRQGPFMKTVEEGGKVVVDALTDGQNHNGDIIGPDGSVMSKIV